MCMHGVCAHTCVKQEESVFPLLGGRPHVGSGRLLSACQLTGPRVGEALSAGVPHRRLLSQCPHLDLLERFTPLSVFMTSRDLVQPLGNESGQ